LNLQMDTTQLSRFKSSSQRARVLTELWGASNLYCANCSTERLTQARPNTEAIDYSCEGCSATFQLKSQRSPLRGRVVDAGYEAMCRAVRANRTPNLFVLRYDSISWSVLDVLLVPAFAFSLSAVEKRKPLSETARRAGWVGCNILLDSIPVDARIPIITSKMVEDKMFVRAQYQKLAPLKRIEPNLRGWLLDVMQAARSLRKPEFTIEEIYKSEAHLAQLHPDNMHIKAKVRQQLQKLRDVGLLRFVGDGVYRWSDSGGWNVSGTDRTN